MPDEFYNHKVSGEFADDLTAGRFTFPLVHAIDVMKNDEVYGKWNISARVVGPISGENLSQIK